MHHKESKNKNKNKIHDYLTMTSTGELNKMKLSI